ncbi:MAG: Rrf2 family transcriptional regulator [Selenomonadaceae bacterium]|nr:Rrf2 family transcriptional regulator [Selenomonadaceae bacterium]
MKVSAKGRYALAALVYIARNYDSGNLVTTLTIAEELNISKIYLEQVFSLLKGAGLVTSVKGSRGGYQLAKSPKNITAYHVLSVIENSFSEEVMPATSGKMPEIDNAIAAQVYRPLDEKLRDFLSGVSLADILAAVERDAASPMYYI